MYGICTGATAFRHVILLLSSSRAFHLQKVLLQINCYIIALWNLCVKPNLARPPCSM